MKEPVIIKSYQMNGFKLVMDPNVAFEEILAALAERLKKSKKFFKEIPKGLLFEGRELSLEEQKAILSCIRENSDMNIVCVIEEDKQLQETINEEVKKACMELEQRRAEEKAKAEERKENTKAHTEEKKENTQPDKENKENVQPQKEEKENIHPQKEKKQSIEKAALETVKNLSKKMSMQDPGLFYKGSLRSGQVLESDQSIIMLGDVKPGANVISKGNVIVLGSLRGNVFAGADGNKQAFVVALDMQPVQVRIDDFIARSPDEPEKEKVKQAKIAFLEGENIYIEPVTREVFNDIHI